MTLLAEPTQGGFSARLLGTLPWNQVQGASSEDAKQLSACIQQISILQQKQEDSKHPTVMFSVLDRYSVLTVRQWSAHQNLM